MLYCSQLRVFIHYPCSIFTLSALLLGDILIILPEANLLPRLSSQLQNALMQRYERNRMSRVEKKKKKTRRLHKASNTNKAS